jgi:hypothetical protein
MFHGLCSGSPSSIAWQTHPGELVSSLLSEHPLGHQIIHLELSAAHKPLLVTFDCLAVPYIFNSRLPSSFIDEVDILTTELVLRDFVVCLDT